MKITIVTYIMIACCATLQAGISGRAFGFDTTRPAVGKPMPDFVLNDVRHYGKTHVSLQDFSGKWLFMDFWYRGCTTCIASFSKINELQRHFRNSAQFLLIGMNDKFSFGEGIEALYERLRQKQDLELAVAFDSTLRQRWNIYSVPHIIVVDPHGIVRSITDGLDMSVDNVQHMIDGKGVLFSRRDVEKKEFNAASSIESGEHLLYGSVLSEWNGEKQSVTNIEDYLNYYSSRPGFRVSGCSLYWLYNLAYFGKISWLSRSDSLYDQVYPRAVLEISDPMPFDVDLISKKGAYNYELIIAPERCTKGEVMAILQRELKNAFNYNVVLEARMMPVWKLIALPGASQKLMTKGGTPKYTNNITADGGAAGFGFRNRSTSHLLDLIRRYDHTIPYFDETNLGHNIDIDLDVLMSDRQQVIIELQKNGLDLVMDQKLMKVLVIRDGEL